MGTFLSAVLLALSLTLSGCIVIPVGDLLRGPALREQTLQEGAGFFSKEKIAIVDIDGMITGGESGSLLFPQENAVSETKARLDMARSDPEVKAVVLRISSPGGEATSCDILHHEVKKFKKDSGLPVVACIVDQGTSGAYYIAVAADAIVAHPTSIVGSIGVILNSVDLSGLLAKIGVSTAPIKSAEKKDLNSPFRPMTPEERKILQKLVDDTYQRFVEVVDEGRPDLKKEDVLALADGRVVSGSEAASLKLVDKTGYLADAIEEARSRGGIKSPTVVIYTRVAKSGANIYTDALVSRPAARSMQLSFSADFTQSPKLYYLWQPGF